MGRLYHSNSLSEIKKGHKNGSTAQNRAIHCGIQENASNKDITKYKKQWI